MISKADQHIIKFIIGKDALEATDSNTRFSYISNPDGSIRWLFPKDLKMPMFLNFYSISSFRSKIIYYVIKLSYLLKNPKFVKTGDLDLNIKKQSILNKILEQYDYDGFSIFTGTVGENRKAIIELHKDKKTFIFIKVALTESAKVLVENEVKKLQFLDLIHFKKLTVPKLLNSSQKNIVEINNIKPNNFKQKLEIGDVHIDALTELYSKTSKIEKWNNLNVLQISQDNIKFLLDENGIFNELIIKQSKDLSEKLALLSKGILDTKEDVAVSLSHGDFTPWNMFVTKEKLLLFDWELSESKMPLMFDLIHFVFQTDVLINKRDYQDIKAALKVLLQESKVQLIMREFNVSFNKSYTFYLIYIVSYYLKKYAVQQNLHEQVFWLIKVWDEAISDLLNKEGEVFEEIEI
ncbi:MAG: phosphotransferase [Bizionia sp.]|nr:phosphotransferase [Bizionia sp.]